MSQLALFDLAAPAAPRTHPAARCDGTCVVHALLPNMAYACGETILTTEGHFVLGSNRFADVTCPGCRAQGVERIRWRMCRQQDRCVLCHGHALTGLPWCKTCGVER